MTLKIHIFPLLAALTVTLAQEAPQLTIQPENPTIRRDRNKMGYFTCKVSPKHTELTTDIVWLDPSGAEVPDERQNRIYSSAKIDGKARELYVTKIKDEDSGTYTCKARYGSNQEISKSFTLLVYMGIRWEDAPLRQNPVRGTDALIRCVVLANPPAIIEWFRGADIIESGGRYSAQKDGLLIRNVSSGDDGIYTCRAKVPDEGEMEERFIEVEVFSPPEISVPEPDAEVIVTEDEAGITRCMATGKPTPTRSWVTADGTDASEIDGISVDAADGTLRFEPARRSMAGEYHCIARNLVSAVQTTVQVVVRVKPEVVRYENVTASEGSAARVECRVTGSPLPTVWFRRVGSDVSFEEGVSSQDDRVSVHQTEKDLERIGVLTISALSREDDGQYECVATNVGGQTAQPVQLTVQYPPALTAVSAAEVFTWAGNSATLVCSVQAAPEATLTWKFQGRPVVGDPQLVVEGSGAESTLTITPADSDYFGMYTCEATNELGSASLEFQLREATAPGQLFDTIVRELTATSVEFDLPPPEDDGGLPVQQYLIQYVNKGKPWPSNVEVGHQAGNQYTVQNLTPQQTYLFRFAAENAVGLGAWSEPLEETMPKIDVPQPPAITTELEESPAALQNLQDPPVVPSSLPDSYLLNWQPGADNGAEIEDFQVSYYKVINNKNKWRVVSPKHTSVVTAAGELSFRLSSLKPESFYRVELRARNRIGFGDPAQIIVHTAPGVVVAPATSTLASSLVIGVVVGVLLVLILLIDLTCYAVNNRGITHMLCARGSSQTAKLSDEAASEKEPLQTNGSDSKNVPESNGERDVPEVTIDKAQLDAAKDSAV